MVLVIGIAYGKYRSTENAYKKNKDNITDLEKLSMGIYSRDPDSGAIGIYDQDSIMLVQRWNENGIAEIMEEPMDSNEIKKTNDQIYNALREDDNYSKSVVKKIGEVLTGNSELFGGLADTAEIGKWDVEKGYHVIENNTGYTQNDIECAMKILIYGQDYPGKPNPKDSGGVEPPYEEINDIPFELQYACISAISEDEEANIDVFAELEAQIQDK